MRSRIKKTENADAISRCRLDALMPEDVRLLEALEDAVDLSFWGEDNYRRFLEEFPEYFGCKLTWIPDAGDEFLTGFSLARAIFESLEILKIGVLPKFQRLGLGTKLMEEIYEEGLRRGCSRCFLEVRKSNQKAIQFYSAHNFRIAGKRANYYSNPVEDAWIMERLLNQ